MNKPLKIIKDIFLTDILGWGYDFVNNLLKFSVTVYSRSREKN